MGKKRRHHYVPEFYLKGFIDPADKPYIWIYEKGNPKIKKATTKDIAIKKYYYSYRTPEGDKDSETVENFLAEIERKVAPIFKKIKHHKTLSDEERWLFSAFLASMMTRVPAFRNSTEKAIGNLVKRIGPIIAYKESKKIAERLLSGDYTIEVEVSPIFSLAMIPLSVRDFAPIFYKMTWSFFQATKNCKFITSDNPLYFYDPTYNRKSPYGVGLIFKNIEVVFPISQELIFLGTWGRWQEGYTPIVLDKTIEEINRKTVIFALRFVYSSRKSENLNNLVQKYKDSWSTYI